MTTTDSSAPIAVLHRIRPRRPTAKAAASPAVRVLLADGQGLVRAGFRLLLEATERISVVGEAASGEEAVAVAHTPAPTSTTTSTRGSSSPATASAARTPA
jgi:hypothetical protein